MATSSANGCCPLYRLEIGIIFSKKLTGIWCSCTSWCNAPVRLCLPVNIYLIGRVATHEIRLIVLSHTHEGSFRKASIRWIKFDEVSIADTAVEG